MEGHFGEVWAWADKATGACLQVVMFVANGAGFVGVHLMTTQSGLLVHCAGPDIVKDSWLALDTDGYGNKWVRVA
jgi:hypothetical protein